MTDTSGRIQPFDDQADRARNPLLAYLAESGPHSAGERDRVHRPQDGVAAVDGPAEMPRQVPMDR